MSQQERKIIVIPAKPQAAVQEAQRSLRVAAYCRVSTEEEEQQSSYEAQCIYYTEKIMTTPGWTMVDIYADEGISGTSTKNRDDFNRMIRHCRKGKIDLILTKSISRFARNTVDCLNYIRALKAMGIGICFEKENIDTLTMDSELIVTFMGAFAQSESESMSKNISWGKRKAMKDGKVSVNFNKLYGYRQEKDQLPEIIPEHAAVIQSIVKDYLQGASLRMIQENLHQKGILSPSGEAEWKISAIRSILTNEKYCGDVLMQKTFVQDCISKKVVKNTGQLPMYLVEDNHPAIITREQYRAVQAEMSRRNAGQSPSKKNAPTGKTSYASKYALSERLVCGECGTLYRRCVWSRNGKRKVVWRCVSRLDYGTKFCHDSPSMEEEALQRAVLSAINSLMSNKEGLAQQITDTITQELITLPDSEVTLGRIRRRIGELEGEFQTLLDRASKEVWEKYTEQFKTLNEEMTALKAQQDEITKQLQTNSMATERLRNVKMALDQADHNLSQWDETTIRQLVHTVKVISADRIIVYLTDGTEIEQEVASKASSP